MHVLCCYLSTLGDLRWESEVEVEVEVDVEGPEWVGGGSSVSSMNPPPRNRNYPVMER